MYPRNPLEPHYTLQEIAKEWKVVAETVRKESINEPGVLVLGSQRRKDGKRNYVILGIPESVLKRAYERRTQRKFHAPSSCISVSRSRIGSSKNSSSISKQRAMGIKEYVKARSVKSLT